MSDNQKEGTYFQKALAKFTVEFAAGDAIRLLSDKGFNVEEIHDKLSFPVARKTIGELVWSHYLDNGTICLFDPERQSKKLVTSYKKVQNSYGKVSFLQVQKDIRLTGEYVRCDFGKRLYCNREEFLDRINRLDERDRNYVLGLPWPLEPVYHIKDERMMRIIQILEGSGEEMTKDNSEKSE